jgi:hypothetical protein
MCRRHLIIEMKYVDDTKSVEDTKLFRWNVSTTLNVSRTLNFLLSMLHEGYGGMEAGVFCSCGRKDYSQLLLCRTLAGWPTARWRLSQSARRHCAGSSRLCKVSKQENFAGLAKSLANLQRHETESDDFVSRIISRGAPLRSGGDVRALDVGENYVACTEGAGNGCERAGPGHSCWYHAVWWDTNCGWLSSRTASCEGSSSTPEGVCYCSWIMLSTILLTPPLPC